MPNIGIPELIWFVPIVAAYLVWSKVIVPRRGKSRSDPAKNGAVEGWENPYTPSDVKPEYNEDGTPKGWR